MARHTKSGQNSSTSMEAANERKVPSNISQNGFRLNRTSTASKNENTIVIKVQKIIVVSRIFTQRYSFFRLFRFRRIFS